MSNPSKRKGTAYESLVTSYLQQHGFPYAERRTLRGSKDCGDVSGVPGFVLELKATKSIDLAAAVDEAEAERVNDGAQFAVAVIKRRNRSVSESYVVMTLEQFAELEGDLYREVRR